MNLTPDPVGILVANNIPLSAFNPPVPTVMTLANGTTTTIIDNNGYTFLDWLLTASPGLFGTIGGWANPTGVALMIILTIMFICSMSWVRKGGYFEVRTRMGLFILFIYRTDHHNL